LHDFLEICPWKIHSLIVAANILNAIFTQTALLSPQVTGSITETISVRKKRSNKQTEARIEQEKQTRCPHQNARTKASKVQMQLTLLKRGRIPLNEHSNMEV